MSDDMSVQAVAAAYTKLVKQMRDRGIEPVSWEVTIHEPYVKKFADMSDDELIQWATDNPLAPMPCDDIRSVIRLATGELMIVRSYAKIVAANLETSIDDYTAYDRGDLCSELDRALGDLIERTMHRYMPRNIARSVRRNKISELADSIIGYDQTHGESNSNPS